MHAVTQLDPDPEVAGLVRSLWHCAELGAVDETVMPTTGGMVVLTTHDGRGRPTVTWRPPGDRARPVPGSVGRLSVGVMLAPGTVALADDLVDVLARELRGRSQAQLDWREPAPVLDVVRAVTGDLVAGTGPPATLRWVEARIRAGAGVGDVCRQIGMERRRLALAYVAAYGIGLKRYGRLCRFEAALAMLRRADAPPLASIAAEAGYADQAHMTRDIRSLAGCTPGALHRREGPSAAHVTVETFKTAGA